MMLHIMCNHACDICIIIDRCTDIWASLVTQMVKNPPVTQETWVLFLDWKDPLEKEMAAHSSILAGTEEPGRLQSMGSQRVLQD